MIFENIPDWPDRIKKPPLPDGYEWVCLRPALGIPNHNGCYWWWIRVKESRPRGYIIKMDKDYFAFPENAIKYAIKSAKQHAKKKQLKIQN